MKKNFILFLLSTITLCNAAEKQEGLPFSLFELVGQGNPEAVRAAIKSPGVDVNALTRVGDAYNSWFETPLIRAASFNDPEHNEIMRILLDEGAESSWTIFRKDNSGNPPFKETAFLRAVRCFTSAFFILVSHPRFTVTQEEIVQARTYLQNRTPDSGIAYFTAGSLFSHINTFLRPHDHDSVFTPDDRALRTMLTDALARNDSQALQHALALGANPKSCFYTERSNTFTPVTLHAVALNKSNSLTHFQMLLDAGAQVSDSVINRPFHRVNDKVIKETPLSKAFCSGNEELFMYLCTLPEGPEGKDLLISFVEDFDPRAYPDPAVTERACASLIRFAHLVPDPSDKQKLASVFSTLAWVTPETKRILSDTYPQSAEEEQIKLGMEIK